MEADEAARNHERAARDFAEALLEVHEARERLFFLVKEEEDAEVFVRAVERYQRACSTMCRAQEALNEAQSADPRPLCLECLNRIFPTELKTTCSATGYRRPHYFEEKP